LKDREFQLPRLGSSNLLVKNAIGGWKVSGLYSALSGPPFTVNGGQGNNNSFFKEYQDAPGTMDVRQGGKS
jgi:hypothetical protein